MNNDKGNPILTMNITEPACTHDGACPIPGHTTFYRTAEWNPPPLNGQKITTWRGHR